MRLLDVSTAYLGAGARFGMGMYVGELGPRPEKPLELYEFEGCPMCRKVREALSILDLDAYIYPCPRGGERYREIVLEKGGKKQFPYFIDPNTGAQMYESSDIVRYLYERYGSGKPHPLLRLGPITIISSQLASLARPLSGAFKEPSRAPEKPLELWAFEASPYCRLAREKLCSMELPYLLHNVAKKSQKRKAFVERSGKMMVPYLVDPNTGTEMFESADIISYLEQTYAA